MCPSPTVRFAARDAIHGRMFILLMVFLSWLTFTTQTALAQPVTWTFRPSGQPGVRSNSAMAYDSARGVTVLFGGGASVLNGDTWEWDGSVWSLRATTGPVPRRGHAMAYDSARGVTVLFGGTGSANHADTWEWNGNTWTQRQVSGPDARSYMSMAYDSARGVTVLFAGRDSGGQLDRETWEWNGSIWSLRSNTGPSARNGHAMVYDSARGVSVLFGGFDGALVGDTWEWNGSTWTQRPASGPSPRIAPMAYDSARGITVLFGGDSILPFGNAETWEWNGTAWTQQVVPGPGTRKYHVMAYDSGRGVTLTYGGDTGFAYYIDTWELCPDAITSQPLGISICPGTNVSFSVTAVSPGGTLTYQWQKKNPNFVNVYNDIFNGPTGNGGTYSGTQSATLTISGITVNDASEYRCIVTGRCLSMTSDNALLDVVPPITILFEPASQTACFAGNASMSVTTSPPGAPFAYQWQKRNPIFFNVYNDLFDGPTGNGGSISGAQTPTLNFAGVFPNDYGDYRCVITSACQSAISNDASLTETPAPAVISGPDVASGCNGGTGTISISADPPGSTYQWQRYVGPCILCYVDVFDGPTGSGGILSGSQSPTLTITDLNLFETYPQYRCIVTGPCPNTQPAASADAFFSITFPPLAAAPQAPEVCPGGTVSISMNTSNVTSFLWEYYSSPLSIWVAIGDGPLNDFPAGFSCAVSGSSTDTITLSNTFLGSPLPIRFSGGNICQIMAPIQTTLDYAGAPTITSQPQTTNYCHGQPSSFTVGASSQLPLTYQWQLYHTGLLQWINLIDGFYVGGNTGLSGTIAGALTPTLTFTLSTIGSVAPDQPFRCIVSNGCQSSITNPANLHICIADVDCDGTITSQDYFNFITAFFNSDFLADVNTDGIVTSQDYFDFITAFFNGC